MSANALRSSVEQVRITAVPGEDVVVLQIANGPTLVLHPETARDLILAQEDANSSVAGRLPDADSAPHEVEVPPRLRWRGLDASSAVRVRGGLDDVPLSALEVVTDVIQDKAADLVAAKIADLVDRHVDEGVYPLARDGLTPLKGRVPALETVPAADGAPLLVLVHGTFVDTSTTFGKLWSLHPEAVGKLFAHYHERVYALDHCTLGKSPIENALTLASHLPSGAKLHLLTHSRGGLVGEILARVCARPDLTQGDLEPFAGAGHEKQLADLVALAKLARDKQLKVERMLRVACPARGTLLASKRLDAYVSILKWALALAGVPFVPGLIDFLVAVAARRADPSLLPGLAALIPDSPLQQWLHSVDEPIAGELRVVAGDIEGDSVVSWVKTLLADAFFWTDNDLVVQTRSMYGGAPRGPARAQFLLDAGGKVTHFNYFANERTVQAVVDGLTQDTAKDFRTIGPLSWAGEDASGARAALRVRARSAAASSRPAVFVLPGILGSHLKVNEKRVWLSWRIVGGLRCLEYTGKADHVAPDGPIGMFYDDLIDFLSDTHDVIPFAFDWRQPIEKEAGRLGTEVERAIAARRASGQPVRLIAHSMGGIVARTMMLERPDVWSQLIAHEGARLLMLGTPNAGSWAPMQVLSGDDDFGNTLAFVGAPMHDQQARQLMAQMPGFLQLQAKLRDDRFALGKEQTWRQLAEDDLRIILMNSWWHSDALQKGAYRWGIPPQHVLDLALRLRTRLDEQLDQPGFGKQLTLVVGRAKFTPDGYTLSSDGLDYLNAVDGGDGRVTLAEALLPGVPTWLLDCAHSELPDAEHAFDAYLDLLTKGDTKRLERLGARRDAPRADAESGIAHVRSRPSRALLSRLTPLESLQAVLEGSSAVPEQAAAVPHGVALRVTILNGNLKFVRQPLMVGHYRSGILTGAERTVDKLIGGAMEQSLRLRRYPHWPGASDVFLNRHRDPNDGRLTPQPEAVSVVGLGEEGELTSAALSLSVRQGVIAWVKRVVESAGGAPTHIELAATLIGSGGAGISAGVSAQAIAQGVRDANEKLTSLGWPVVSQLVLVELFRNRAIEAWQGLELQAAAVPGYLQIAEQIETGTGPLERPLDLDYRGADHDFIRASWIDDGEQDGKIEYTVDTRRARSELRARSAQSKLLRGFLAGASNDGNPDEQIGRTLFQLLVPLEMQPLLGGTGQVVLELDPKTAAIPWELLETPDERGARSDRRPWAIRSRLIRKLRTGVFREEVADAGADDNVLVVGDPLCDDRSTYPSLPGAHAEAQAVARQLGAADVVRGQQRVHALPRNADMRTVLNALFARPYRIVHLAGHGQEGALGGVVLSGGSFLGPHEIESMVVVPQLVFVNCCHLAARDFDAPANPYDRAAFAASVATALVNVGVRCVIAAGWAVDDRAAEVFAATFYEQLLLQRKFMDAVTAAREAARRMRGNTWAAYQCYGDPDWTYRTDGETITPDASSMRETYSMIASPTQLAGALEALSVESRFDGRSAGQQRDKIHYLEERFAAHWAGTGSIAEAFAAAYADDGCVADGIRWYEKALGADGTASLRAHERLLQLQVTCACQELEAARRTPGIAADENVARARETIREAVAELATLADRRRTFETLSLCGWACERLARLEGAAMAAPAESAAVANMARYYAEAERVALEAGRADVANAALNRMAAELVLHAKDDAWRGFDADATQELRASLAAQIAAGPDFASLAGMNELDVYEALAERKLATRFPELRADYELLHERASGALLWKLSYGRAEFVLPRLAGRCPDEDAAIDALLGLLRSFADEPDRTVTASPS